MGIRRIHVFGNRHYPRVIGYSGYRANIRHHQKAYSDLTDFEHNYQNPDTLRVFLLNAERAIPGFGMIAKIEQTQKGHL